MTFGRDRWRFYRILEEELIEFDKIIPVDSDQLDVTSPRLAEIIIGASIHFESLLKDIAIRAGKLKKEKKNDTNISDIRKMFPELSNKREVRIKRVKGNNSSIKPLDDWSNTSPIFWKKYRELKHDIYETWKEYAKYKYAIESVASLLICNFECEIRTNPSIYPHGSLFEEGSITFNNEYVTYPISISYPKDVLTPNDYLIKTDFFEYHRLIEDIAFSEIQHKVRRVHER